jgi:hypothetical protein
MPPNKQNARDGEGHASVLSILGGRSTDNTEIVEIVNSGALNLEADISVSAECDWTPLQADICMSIALAKRDAFMAEAQRVAAFVRLGFITRTVAADYLNEAAIYNQLTFEYGTDAIQAIMSAALSEAGA